MSKESPGQRPVYQPGKNFAASPLPIVELTDSAWTRVHLDVHDPVFFSRNTNHRFSPAEGEYQVMYAACDFRTSFMEVFGDTILAQREDTGKSMGPCISAARWYHSMCTIISPESLKLCDFTTSEARAAMHTDLSSLLLPDLSIPQIWSDAIMSHPDKVDGILYPSRFTGEACVAVFDTGITINAGQPVPFPNYAEALVALDELNIALV